MKNQARCPMFGLVDPLREKLAHGFGIGAIARYLAWYRMAGNIRR
jgi:hypothetical protein